MKRIVLLVCCAVVSVVFAAVTSTATWDYSVNTGNTSPAAAALWTDAGNWDVNPEYPSGAQWKAVLTGATGMRYISIPGPLTLGAFSATKYGTSSVAGTVVMGDSPITFENTTGHYNISGGRIYADIVKGGTQNEGVLVDSEIAGRIDFGNKLFYLASGVAFHRLDHYAKSSNPVRNDDFSALGVYRGSGYMKVYGPRNGDAHAEEWNVTAGSPFVTRGTSTPNIAVGAVVTCEGVFPAGTFVKRIFSETVIELSSAAADGIESGAKTLSFAAIRPVVTYTIPLLRMNSDSKTYTAFVKHSEDVDMRVVISNMVATTDFHPFHPHVDDSKGYPATIEIHDAAGGDSTYYTGGKKLLFWLGKCHVEFAETGRAGAKSGFPNSVATSYDKYSTTQITVTNGIDASIGLVTNFLNTIVKDGGGSLELGLTNDVSRNTGKIVIEEGTVVLPEGSWVKTVAVSNGASLKVDGVFSPDELIVESGARIGGSGTIVMREAACVDGVVFEDDVKVKFKTNTGDDFVRTAPEYGVVGTPAFWLDAKRTDKMTFKDDDGVNIARVDDVRKTSENDGYLYATNHTLYPTLAKNGDGSANNIYFGTRTGRESSVEEVHDLFWSEPITNIWAVFMVQDTSGNSSQFLGSSARLKALVGRVSDFVRDPSGKWSSPVFYPKNSGTYQLGLINGRFYCNGILRSPLFGYAYGGGSYNVNGGASRYTPQVTETHPLLPVAADCFATDSSLFNRCGGKRVCEVIIYTNKLTQAERLAVCGYLMDKWLDCDVSCDVQTNCVPSLSLAAAPGGFVVDEGELLYAKNVTGAGRFAKSGAGTMFVECLDGRSADVTVAGGTLEVNSRAVPTADDIPADNLLFRMDATRTDLMETTTNNGIERISKWFSAHNGTTRWAKWALGGSDASTNSAIYRANQLNGKAMLDFGTPFSVLKNVDSSGMQYSRVTIRSVFMVQNTANGGSTLIGDQSTWSAGGIMRDGWYLGSSNGQYLLGDFGDWSNALALYSTSGRSEILMSRGSGRTRLNGEWISLGAHGYSGGDDLLSHVSFYPITSNTYAYNNGYGNYCGGGMLGEYIAYSRGLSDRDALKVEAYLRKKWFNADTPGFTPAVASNLTVAAGATLNISGGAPMTVKGTFSGGGTVMGALALAADAVIEVPVAPNDTIQPVTISGTVDLSNGGTVRLVGDARRLRGDYTLVSCPSLTAASAGTWTVEFAGARDPACKYMVFSVDGAFVLRVMPPGISISFR